MKLTDEMLYQHAAEARDIWLNSLPQREEIPEHRFSRRFNRSMNKLIREQHRTPRMRRVVRYVRRTSAAAIIILVITFSGLMTSDEYRTAFISFLTGTPAIDLGTTNLPDADTPQEDPGIVTPPSTNAPETFFTLSFDYLPEGMEERPGAAEWADHFQSVYYESYTGTSFTLEQYLISDDIIPSSITENQKIASEQFSIQGETAYLSETDGTVILTWTYEHVAYRMISYHLSSEESQKIALGITYQ